jgi:cytoskeletal protein CcmA (bactofilin family)
MWNKNEETPGRPGPPATPPSTPPAAAESRVGIAIGPSISIVGELSGDEDLTILGRIEGSVNLPKHSVTIGRTAKVVADIRAKAVNVEGELKGNLQATEQILIRKTATMLGNLAAPRVGLEDGCRFKGSVDMESAQRPEAAARGPEARGAQPPANPGAKPEPAPPRP